MSDTPTTETVEQPKPTNVIAALARVMEEMGGIQRLTPAQRQARGMAGGADGGISYAYRGIDQIAQAAQPLLGKYGVVIVPHVLDTEVFPIQVNGKPWSDMTMEVEWTIYGPGGPDDKIVAVTTGQGRDGADKGANKCNTGAFKNLLLRILCIGDPNDDTDGHTHEADADQSQGTHQVPPQPREDDPIRVTFNRVKALKGTPEGEEIKALAATDGKPLTETGFKADPAWMATVIEVLDGFNVKRAQDAAADETQDPGSNVAASPEAETNVAPEGVDQATGEITLPEKDPNYPVVVVEEGKPKRRTAREIAADKDKEPTDG